MNIEYNEPMNIHTTFKIGGCAKYFAQPSTVAQLETALTYAYEQGVDYLVIGNGSNLLVSDSGYQGMVIKTHLLNSISCSGNIIRAECGAKLSAIAAAAYDNCLTGLEFAGGIPGTVGGGLFMNCGAYGGELGQVTMRVAYLDSNRNVQVKTRADLGFLYRHSWFTDNPDCIILWAEFELRVGERSEIEGAMRTFAAARREKQPLEYPSAGSTFKRPEGHFAAKLIEDCGLKGRAVGGAMVSTKHSGFIINTGGASCTDVLELIDIIKAEVKEKCGIALECEVKVVR